MERKSYTNILLLFPIVLLFIVIYQSTWVWMYTKWIAPDSYSSHGFLIPFISIWLLWQAKTKLENFRLEGSWWGLVILSIGIMIHFMSGIARVHFSSGFSMIFTLSGIIAILFGLKTIYWAWFPIFYLFLMIPLPSVWDTQITLTLKLMATEGATVMLDFLGYIGVREGSFIYFSESKKLLVGDVCSGLRSLLSLIALGLPFVYLIRESWWRKAIMLLCLFPVSFVFNVFRIVLLGIITYHWNAEVASGIIHDISGFLLFAGDLITLWAIYLVLQEKKPGNTSAQEMKQLEAINSPNENTLHTFQKMLIGGYQKFSTLARMPNFQAKYIALLCILTITCWVSIQYLYVTYPTENKSYTQGIPTRFGEWEAAHDFPTNDRTIELLETSDILTRYYRRNLHEPPVMLSVVASASSNRKIAHPPEICYRGMGFEVMRYQKVTLDTGIEAILLLVYNNRNHELVLYWYKFEDIFTSDYYAHQTNVLFNFFRKQKGGLALIRLSVTMNAVNIDKHFKILQDFARDILPILKEKLP